MFPNPDTGGGWYCSDCGAYVYNGTPHHHGGYVYGQNFYPYFPIFVDNAALARIADALEKLIEILERTR